MYRWSFLTDLCFSLFGNSLVFATATGLSECVESSHLQAFCANDDKASGNLIAIKKDTLQATEENALLEFVQNGVVDFFRACSVCSPLPRAAFQYNDDGSLYYSFGIDYAPCNGVIDRRKNSVLSEKEIDRTIQFFKTRKLPFIWWTFAKNLESKGFQFGGNFTGIALDISHGIPKEKASPPALKIEVVHSEDKLRVFSELSATLFQVKAPVEQLQAGNCEIMKQGEQVFFLAYINEVPVGIVSFSTNPSSAGIWNLGTVPQYRKQGVASALVHAALVEAQKRHCKQVMAVLMPKGMAWGLFTKFGFKEVCTFPCYVYGASADELE